MKLVVRGSIELAPGTRVELSDDAVQFVVKGSGWLGIPWRAWEELYRHTIRWRRLGRD
jgi:hypothetical protein